MSHNLLGRAFERLELRRGGRIARLVRPYVEPGDSVLDVGCGPLVVAHELKALAAVRLVGLETLNYRKRALPLVLYAGGSMPFQSCSFDVVLVAFVLHHCGDGGVGVLREARRIGRKRILVLEDGYEHAAERLLARCIDRLLNRLENPAVPTPCQFRSATAWERLFRDIGLQVEELRTVRTTPVLETRQRLYVLRP